MHVPTQKQPSKTKHTQKTSLHDAFGRLVTGVCGAAAKPSHLNTAASLCEAEEEEEEERGPDRALNLSRPVKHSSGHTHTHTLTLTHSSHE